MTSQRRPQLQWRALASSRTKRCATPPLSQRSPHSSQPPAQFSFWQFITWEGWKSSGKYGFSLRLIIIFLSVRPCVRVRSWTYLQPLPLWPPPPLPLQMRVLCSIVHPVMQHLYWFSKNTLKWDPRPPPSTRISRRSFQFGFSSTKLYSDFSREFRSLRRESGLWNGIIVWITEITT